ncbi:FIST signal transduction protein [Hoeflea prorocentri]|uniref:FIST C-terminal domain-containing protein n=1 Tax=Hoeflea prorocentri TaxID=1922333 RepID=A0A9X3UEZ9_9HYPH|nr:FIST N-terminal domain-containing protein [Hoeflea prorocentri]MCY6379628.1 FIST C-terminal domain-containing protein [Hoeflea prorocentri]MDA5397428.1 FIST C-terminal domain-containing protein [Hoeflea prorocentri]
MKITVESAATAEDLARQLNAGPYDFVSVHNNHEAKPAALQGLSNLPRLHGATSCLGAMTQAGMVEGLSAFAIKDPVGAYGTALASLEDDPRAAARDATNRALMDADRIGERPEIIWVSATPGTEEDVLAGIEDVTGPEVPIIGGSAADNSVAGDWYVFDQAEKCSAGVVVSVLFPSQPVSFAYQNGYSPSQHSGLVTRATDRTIHEIDGRPALDVYGEWTGGAISIDKSEESVQTILSESTLWPLGREISQVGQVPFYLLAHPAYADQSGDLQLFATVAEGEELTLMNGTVEGLIERAGRVAALARASGRTTDKPIDGALMIYCGGCMLSVRDQMPEVVAGVNAALGDAPFLGAFTFGEQGSLLRAGNRHGNLMISCIVFG